MEKLWAMLQPTVVQHGSFRTRGELGRVRSQQKGSMRTNCIDCLDRTNVVQGMLAKKALEALLRELLLLDVNDDLKSQFPQVLYKDNRTVLLRTLRIVPRPRPSPNKYV